MKKTIIKVTVLHPDEYDLSGQSLKDISYEIDEGCWLGTSEIVSVQAVPADKLREECLALGNDGEFFQEPE